MIRRWYYSVEGHWGHLGQMQLAAIRAGRSLWGDMVAIAMGMAAESFTSVEPARTGFRGSSITSAGTSHGKFTIAR